MSDQLIFVSVFLKVFQIKQKNSQFLKNEFEPKIKQKNSKFLKNLDLEQEKIQNRSKTSIWKQKNRVASRPDLSQK